MRRANKEISCVANCRRREESTRAEWTSIIYSAMFASVSSALALRHFHENHVLYRCVCVRRACGYVIEDH